MLETCVSLYDCERVLIEKFQEVKFIGEIELSPEDIRKLINFIIIELDPDPKYGLNLLKQKAPATISAFLVWQGIIEYEEGDYWTPALRAIGLEEPRWQQELGETFIDFLRCMDLPDFPIEGALRFVTPILLHGGIPQKCLGQFFDYVIMDMVEFNLVTGDEIRDYLHSLREDEKTRVALRQKLKELKQSESKCRKEAKDLASFIDLRQEAVKLRESVGNPDEWRHVPEDYETFRLDKLNEIEDINNEISSLQSDERLCLDRISAFTREHEAVLQLGQLVCVISVELPAVLRDKAELASLQADEAACMAKLEEYAGSIQGEALWLSSSDEALTRLSADTVDTLNALVETASRLDALKSRLSQLYDEADQFVPQPIKPGTSFWIGSASLPAALCMWLITGHSPLGLGIAIALALSGCLSIILSLQRFQEAYRDNKRRKARYDAISKEVSKTQSKIADFETAVSSIMEELPHEPQVIMKAILSKTGGFGGGTVDSSGRTDDASGGTVDALRVALPELRSVADVFASYHRLLLRRGELIDSIAEWEQRLDELLVLAGLPGLDRNSELQNESGSEPEIQDGNDRCRGQRSIDDFCDSDTLKSAVELLKASLDDAIHRSVDTMNARAHLREYIQPRLHALYNEATEIEIHIRELDESVTGLGNGSFETGLGVLKSKHEAFLELDKVNAGIYSAGQALFSLADKDKYELEDLLHLYDTKVQVLKELALSIEDTEVELQDYPPAYPYTDEPVQRFVLYGDEWAEKWIVGCVDLLELAKGEEEIPGDFRPDLPLRVVRGFKEWWESRKAAIQDEGFSYEYSGERLPAPQIRLDPIHADIKIVVDSQRFKLEYAEGASSFSIVITSPTSPGWSKTLPLKPIRSRMPGLAETERIEYILPILDKAFSETDTHMDSSRDITADTDGSTTVDADSGNLLDDALGTIVDGHSTMTEVSPITMGLPGLADAYQVSMLIGDVKHVTWDLKVFDDKTPCLIFSEDGKLIDSGYLPRSRLWFVLPRDRGFTKRVPMIQDATPLYLKDACRIVLMDLTMVDTVSVGDGRGGEFEFRVARDKVSEPMLVCGQPISGVSIDGIPLYIGAPPHLMIPLSNDTEASAWDVVLRYGGGVLAERKQFQLDELCSIAEVKEMDGSVEIPLGIPELLGPNPVGGYTIHLRHRGRRRSQFSLGFVVVPDFWYQFEPSIVFPVAGDESRVKLLVSVPDGARFNVDSPSEILSSEDGEYQIQVDPAESLVTGMLEILLTDDEIHIPITIEIPKVRWRLKEGREDGDTDWSCHVEEVFVSDLNRPNILLLQLELPVHISGVHFALDDRQYYKAPAKCGTAEVSLLQFMDTLKAGGSVGEITARLLDSSGRLVGEGSILRLRCRWEVSDFICVRKKSCGIWHLEFTWQEKGQAEDRILRIWRMWEPWAEPLKWHIPEGEMSPAVDVDEDHLPQGAYLVKFSVLDRWAPAGAGDSFPGDEFNTFIVHLHDDRPYLEVWDIHWLSNYEAKITGSVAGTPQGTCVCARLFGVRAGQACSWTAYGKTDSTGRFTIHVLGAPIQEEGHVAARKAGTKHSIKDRDRIKNSARWIGITIDTEPKSHLFAVLPEHAPLEWWFAPKPASPFLLEWPLASQLRESLLSQETSSLPGVSEQASSVSPSFTGYSPIVRIQCEEGSLEQPDLSEEDSRKVIKAWLGDDDKVEVAIRIGGATDKAVVSWSELRDSLRISLSTGRVHCTTCNKLVANQHTWQMYHYPKCKSLYPEKKDVTASLLIVDDPIKIASAQLSAYPLAGHRPRTLHSGSTHGALPLELSGVDDSNDYLTKLTGFLLSLERQLISALLRSEAKNGHEPH